MSNPIVVLDTFGSLRDLSNADLVLQEGLSLIGVDEPDEDEDLEGHGTAQYDRDNKWWVFELDEEGAFLLGFLGPGAMPFKSASIRLGRMCARPPNARVERRAPKL